MLTVTSRDELLAYIFDKTDGHCAYCGKQLVWENYGDLDGRGGWEVDHRIASSRGGSSDPDNLVPACWECNRKKGAGDSGEFSNQFEYDSTMSGVYDIAGLPPGEFGLNRRRHRRN